VQSLRAKLDEFQRQRPTAVFLRQLEQRKNRQNFSTGWFPVLSVAFSTMALVLVAPILLKSEHASHRNKGSSFSVFYKRPGMKAAEKVTPDLLLRAGDALRFSYLAPGDGHLAIFDLDTTGRVTVFYPFGGDRPARIQGGSTMLLPNSVILDKSPGYEWLICV